MRCPECGAEAGENVKFCPRCGHSFDPWTRRPIQQYAHPARRNDDSKTAIIIIVVVIAVVVVPIILSALMYFMVVGFGTDNRQTTPSISFTRTEVTGGQKFTVAGVVYEAYWSDIMISLGDGPNSVSWTPPDWKFVEHGDYRQYSGGPSMFGQIVVWFNITDENGMVVNPGDYFTLTTGGPYQWSVGTEYIVSLTFLPTSELIDDLSFVP